MSSINGYRHVLVGRRVGCFGGNPCRSVADSGQLGVLAERQRTVAAVLCLKTVPRLRTSRGGAARTRRGTLFGAGGASEIGGRTSPLLRRPRAGAANTGPRP
jgi:hypothetical protein